VRFSAAAQICVFLLVVSTILVYLGSWSCRLSRFVSSRQRKKDRKRQTTRKIARETGGAGVHIAKNENVKVT